MAVAKTTFLTAVCKHAGINLNTPVTVQQETTNGNTTNHYNPDDVCKWAGATDTVTVTVPLKEAFLNPNTMCWHCIYPHIEQHLISLLGEPVAAIFTTDLPWDYAKDMKLLGGTSAARARISLDIEQETRAEFRHWRNQLAHNNAPQSLLNWVDNLLTASEPDTSNSTLRNTARAALARKHTGDWDAALTTTPTIVIRANTAHRMNKTAELWRQAFQIYTDTNLTIHQLPAALIGPLITQSVPTANGPIPGHDFYIAPDGTEQLPTDLWATIGALTADGHPILDAVRTTCALHNHPSPI
jgi:hypothetical protein